MSISIVPRSDHHKSWFTVFKVFFSAKENPSEYAWRYVCIIPAFVAFCTGIILYTISDDYPKGNTAELVANGVMEEKRAVASCSTASFNANTWLLAVQYACCFGVELTMNSASALYFKDEFGVSTESAAAIASIFGWMNLFARGLGGFISDYSNVRYGMKGRLYTQAIMLLCEGALVLIFANSGSLAAGIVTLVMFSLFVQAAEGSSYGIVPYVDKTYAGSVTGIVGAGGNAGAVVFSLLFRELDYRDAFLWMGIAVIFSSLLSLCVIIRGQTTMFCGGGNADVGPVSEEDFDEEVQALKKMEGASEPF